MSKNVFIPFILVFMSPWLYADTIEIAYKDLYSHLRKLDNEDTQHLQFAFGFLKVPKKQTLCTITKGEVITDKQVLPVAVTPEQRFTVPFEKALKMADALVRIEVDTPKNQCDMSVQLETTAQWLKHSYSRTDLEIILSQYRNFFNEMGGFMSFMMPQVTGLQIHFSDESLSQPIADGVFIVAGVLRINSEQIKNLTTLSLPEKPLRITALTQR